MIPQTEEFGRTIEDSQFTGSEINYYFICKRKLWLFSHNIELEPESDLVKLGKLLHENRYKRKMKEIQVDRIKVDFIESKQALTIEQSGKTNPQFGSNIAVTDTQSPSENKEMNLNAGHVSSFASVLDSKKAVVIHEVKRSKKMQDAHLYQILYYMYWLKENYGVNVTCGVLHYPLLNQNVDVSLTEDRIKQIEQAMVGISQVNSLAKPPEPVWKGYCRSCAYRDLCWG